MQDLKAETVSAQQILTGRQLDKAEMSVQQKLGQTLILIWTLEQLAGLTHQI